ncbi:MAG: fumarylacetoacetate hydrolase family protein [Pseudonocardia sp.]|mgnify:CR=1 FL=1|uniref:fumarylacetoacetate hydrolase family protein n=1 Tax=unclassified Pseudonocardia TaxID=2619320 RepID=UPI00086837A1|nr:MULTISPECIES: fumarylacetoacetate hydrolase family protein [unclassified Pseudonocardia]MBN9112200.1 fumarylacetoacetate hydrolase family protein [Pseudonocardia sp.]ODU30137.1 MAG: fumarylacetoacetate hydrolase [Pseudonocardia sp. SCN 72-51]ODV03061.1 MAG: fumarylacetoacetate hydrolase [Pseudonocardia sp. SCN 73-27]
MRIANLDGRAVLVEGDTAVDIAASSAGRFGPDPQQLFASWPEFRSWAGAASGPTLAVDTDRLGPPVPRPPQVFAIGLNYLDHAAEAGAEPPRHPSVFTKFPSCLAGPRGAVEISSRMLVDWEVELVVVIGIGGRDIPADQGWTHVAGLTVGQDLSDRRLQMRKPVPEQYSLGKSCPGFGPTGPYLVTPDELADPDDLAIGCRLGDEQVQQSRTGKMHFSVPDLVARLSGSVTLCPGDLIFTGTPSGVGAFRTPPRWIRPGEVLTSEIEGIGSLTTRFVEADR